MSETSVSRLAPEPVLRAALRVLHVCAFTTRNWTIDGADRRAQVNALWEATHVIPDLLCRWHEGGEAELLMYLDEFDEGFPNELGLRALYERAMAKSSA